MKKCIFDYKNYIFDFDGVIANSLGVKAEAFGSLFEEHGDELVKKVKEYHFSNGGISRYEKFRYYYEVLLNKPITQEIISELDSRFSEKVIEKVIQARETPGIRNFLEELKSRNKACFLVSATPREEIREIVSRKGMNHNFKEVVGSPASKKENLNYIFDKYSLISSESVFFGDAKSDYEAAMDKSVDFIAVVLWTAELSRIDGIYMIDDFSELINNREKDT
jgi:phosphoglycolate phosphatase-like HAD superfamily hydrolase